MIEQLTKEQLVKLSEYTEEGIKIGLATGCEMDEALVRELTDKHRIQCGLPAATHFLVYDSPFQAIASVTPKLTAESALYGQYDINWLQYYQFFRNECGLVKETEQVQYLYELTKLVGWFWMGETATVVTRRPVAIHLRPKGNVQVLHNESGFALEYADGTGIYSLNGLQCLDQKKYSWIFDTPADKLDLKKVMSIENTEIRTEVLKKIGLERAIDLLPGKKLLDEKELTIGGIYQLLEVSFEEGMPRKYLRMICPSSGKLAIEAVPPECATVYNALSWREDGHISATYQVPEMRT